MQQNSLMFFYDHRSIMKSHKLGRHQLLVMKLITESYINHFRKNGYVKKGEKKNFIHSLERSLKALNIHRGIKHLRKVIGNKYFRAELSKILDRRSIGKLQIEMVLKIKIM